MITHVITTNHFEREAKKLLKKYRSLKNELTLFEKDITKNPKQGIKIKENTYKIRLAVKSKGKGKSGGMRIITFVHEVIETDEGELFVYLLSIYDKSDKENISDNLLATLIDEVIIEAENNLETPKSSDNDLNENK